jgi:hypothetical protein
MKALLKNGVPTAVALATLLASGQATANYNFSESFDDTLIAADETGNWILQYSNAGGNYTNNDTGQTEHSVYNPAVNAPTAAPATSNGNYLNFYARYDDSGIRYTALFKNLGGYDGSDGYSANNGEHTLTACYYVPEVSDNGADFDNGVTAGMGVRYSGVGYGQWPGDASLNESVSIPASATRGQWNRLTLTFTLTDAARLDSGVWVRNPVLTAPYVSTAVLWDDMWLGASADAPTDVLCSGRTPPAPPISGDPSAIPALPLGGLFGLIGLVAWLGLRRKA